VKTLRFFFRSQKFKIILTVTCVVLILALITAIVGSSFSPQNGILGGATASITGFFNNISNEISLFFEKFEENTNLMEENLALKQKVNKLTSDLMDFEKAKQENEMYEKYYNANLRFVLNFYLKTCNLLASKRKNININIVNAHNEDPP
jgi:cell shape-determining protein MreC